MWNLNKENTNINRDIGNNDIIFENNQIQLYIERGNFILDIFRSYEIYWIY